VSLQPGTPQYLRPGANLSVAVTSSDPKVLAITTPVVAVPPAGGPGPTTGIQPVAAGTAIVTLGTLAGNPAPASQNQIVFTVSEPAVSKVK
jgi:hypothetical protein